MGHRYSWPTGHRPMAWRSRWGCPGMRRLHTHYRWAMHPPHPGGPYGRTIT